MASDRALPVAQNEELTRRGVAVDESAMSEVRAIGLSRPRAVVTAEFLARLYDAVLQDREDNAGE